MAQFDVYENENQETRQLFPYLLDAQAEMLNNLPTRVVIPLLAISEISKPIPVLNPVFDIEQTQVLMSTPQLVGIHTALLGRKVCSIQDKRDEVIAALDLLFTGY
ncbi:MAG: CcdB family protein [Desulfuromonadaceae bacterium]|nr:CcdB family protein [Desulfuromonadaceae bacterium]MDD5105175.1 CcdB family protein [Desulfuromonadaceae bacterium]